MMTPFAKALGVSTNPGQSQSHTSPAEAIRRPEYRGENTFVGRLAVVEKELENYFLKFHDQALEGDAEGLLVDARGLSNRRNDIAHGIVVPYMTDERPDNEFVLLPAMYRDKRFNAQGEPDFIYSSAEIKRFLEIFERVIQRCIRLHWMVGRGIDPYPGAFIYELDLSRRMG